MTSIAIASWSGNPRLNADYLCYKLGRVISVHLYRFNRESSVFGGRQIEKKFCR